VADMVGGQFGSIAPGGVELKHRTSAR